MSGKVHKFKRGLDYRDSGQTEFEYTHSTLCGYVRKNVVYYKTDNKKITCFYCKRLLEKSD